MGGGRGDGTLGWWGPALKGSSSPTQKSNWDHPWDSRKRKHSPIPPGCRGETVGHRLGDVCTEQEGRAQQQRPWSNLAGTSQERPPFSSEPMPGVQHTNPVFPQPNATEGCLKVCILYHRPLTLHVGKTYLWSSRASINTAKKLSVDSSPWTSEMRAAILIGIINETHGGGSGRRDGKVNIKQRNTVARKKYIFWRVLWYQN